MTSRARAVTPTPLNTASVPTHESAVPRSFWRSGFAMGMVLAIWLAATMGWRGLTQPDEGRYIGVAWEMLRSGNWLVPTLDGLPFFHKPPLFYWISATSISAFGMHDWAGRVPSLLGAIGAAMMMFVFARRWSGLPAARVTLLVLATQPGFFIGAQFANLDMLVAGCMSMTILALAHAVMVLIRDPMPGGQVSGDGLREARTWVVGGWAAAALAVLAKGLIGFVLPGLTVAVWLLLLMKKPMPVVRLLQRLCWWPGPLLFLAIAGPWFVAMQLRFADFFDYFVMEQHFRRFVGHTFNNAHPVWFYIPVLILMTLPWSPWLLRGWASRRSRLALAPADPVKTLMWTWTAVIVVFFSLPNSKLIGYVFAALPPLAWLIGDIAMSRRGTGQASLMAWRISTGVAIAVCLAAVGMAAVFQPPAAGTVATTLASSRQVNEPIMMLDKYVYDLGFALRLHEPVPVVGDWQNPDLAMHDNWRKELLDAGRFSPAAGSRVLVGMPQLMATVCRSPVTWLIGSASSASKNFPLLQGLKPVATSGDTALWRFDRREPYATTAVDCATAATAR